MGDVVGESQQQVLRRTIDSMVEEMKAREIKTDEDYKFLDDWQRRAKQTVKAIDAAFEKERLEKKAPYDDVLERIRSMKRPIDLALPVVTQKMSAYVTEREKARRAEVARLEAESRKGKEDDRLEEAGNLSAMGRAEEADRLLEKRVTVDRAAVAAAAPEKLGKTMEKWVVRVTDKSAFLAFAATAHLSILECVQVNEAALAALARTNKGLSAPGLMVEQTFVPVL